MNQKQQDNVINLEIVLAEMENIAALRGLWRKLSSPAPKQNHMLHIKKHLPYIYMPLMFVHIVSHFLKWIFVKFTQKTTR